MIPMLTVSVLLMVIMVGDCGGECDGVVLLIVMCMVIALVCVM